MQGGHAGVSGISVLEIDSLTHRLSRPHHCQLYFFDLSAKTHFTPLKSHLCHSICLYEREKERLSVIVSLYSRPLTPLHLNLPVPSPRLLIYPAEVVQVNSSGWDASVCR